MEETGDIMDASGSHNMRCKAKKTDKVWAVGIIHARAPLCAPLLLLL